MEALERLINKAPDEFLEAFRDYLHGANQIGWDQFSPEELGTITKFWTDMLEHWNHNLRRHEAVQSK